MLAGLSMRVTLDTAIVGMKFVDAAGRSRDDGAFHLQPGVLRVAGRLRDRGTGQMDAGQLRVGRAADDDHAAQIGALGVAQREAR